MSLENILSQEIVQKLGWTLLHFVWQATAVALLAAILLAGLKNAAANVRYIMGCTALGLIVLLPVATIVLVRVSPPQPMANTEAPLPPAIAPVQVTEETALAEVVEPQEPIMRQSIDAALDTSWKQRAVERLEPALPYLVTGWLIGVFGLSVWHLGGWAQLQRLRRKLIKPVDAALAAAMRQLADKLGVDRAVELLESALVQVPTVVGWLRPVILLPASALTGLSTEQLEALLAHELAHVRRCDYLVNMLQTVIETLGFYHPAVWWISHRIRIERENCCDDLAVGICGDRIRYARALTSMEEIRSGRGELAIAASGGNLLARIRRLVGKDSIEKPSFGWVPAIAEILLIIALAIPTTPALTAKSEPQQAEEAAEPQESEPNALPAGWSLNFDSGSRGDGTEHWIANMAKDLASLRITLKPYDPSKVSLKGERYEFDILSVESEKIGYVRVEPESELGRILPDNHILKPSACLLRYTRRRGTPEDNLRIESGEFPVNLSKPGMYRLQFTPQLGMAEIAGTLGGCYAINSQRVGKGPWVHGFAYQYPAKQYLLDGLPSGTYKLSAVTQDKTGNVLVSQAEVTVSTGEKATVNIVSPPRGNCSLKGTIRGRHKTYQGPVSTLPASEGRWFVLIRKLGSGPVGKTEAYEALTMDSLYVVRGRNIVQEAEDQALYSIEGMVPGEYTVTAIEHPWRGGLPVTRQQSRTLVLKDSDQAALDFDLSDVPKDNTPPAAEAESLGESDSSTKSQQGQTPDPNVPAVAKSAAPSGTDEQQVQTVRVELSVVEVSSDSKMDRETTVLIRNLLGGKITPSDSPAVADLLRQASEATAAAKDESAGVKRITQKQFDKLFDLLTSRGYLKILLRPTLEVVEGQTSRIKTDQNSLEVAVETVKDDAITMAIQADLRSQSTPEGNDQTPLVSTRNFSSRVCISPGQRLIIGGLMRPALPTEPDGDAKGPQAPDKELMCILTASITTPPGDVKPQDAAAVDKNQTTISGRCLDPSGRPLPNALVQFYCRDSGRNSVASMAESRTDSEGRFTLGPITSPNEEDWGHKTYFVFVPAYRHGPAWKDVNLYQQTVEPLELTACNWTTVSGSVVTEDSMPVADAQVWVRGIISGQAAEEPLSTVNRFSTHVPLPGWSATTDSDGSFRIAGIPDGMRIQLFVSHRDFAGSIVHVKAGAHAKIELQPAGVITGRVLYGKTGKPAAGVVVGVQGVEHISIPAGWMATGGLAVTDEQGRYRLESLPGGKYNVYPEAEDLTVVALDSFEVKPGEMREAPDLVLIEGGFIAGRVIDEATGKPVMPGQHSDVAIYGPSRPKSGAAVEISRIREDGSFRIRVAPGSNYIYLRPREDWGRGKEWISSRSPWVDVADGQTVEVDFRVRKLSQEELDKEATRRQTSIFYVPETLDELENSANRLKQLGIAITAYAREHNETLPDGLEQLEDYVQDQEQFRWLRDNVEYLGEARTEQPNATRVPIAYDRTLLGQSSRTQVLFRDSSVRFVGPPELSDLGIVRARRPTQTKPRAEGDVLKSSPLFGIIDSAAYRSTDYEVKWQIPDNGEDQLCVGLITLASYRTTNAWYSRF